MQFKVGDIVEGKITGIKDYGAFADIGEGKSGMVHISEVANTYVNNINDHVKLNDVFKMKILTISDDGKISLSIKKALPQEEKPAGKQTERKRRDFVKKEPPKPDNSFVWEPQKTENASFEEMMNQFKTRSEEKFSDLKRKNVETKRTRRGANK